MRFLLVFTIGLALVVVACTRPTTSPTIAPAPAATPAATPTEPSPPAPTATPSATPVSAPTVAPAPTVALAPTATPTPVLETPAPFFLRVTAPQSESVVTTAVIQVTGETAVDAVASVNSQIAEVDATGRFQVSLTLAEGPNIIEVVASDFSGNQAQELRTVIFVR